MSISYVSESRKASRWDTSKQEKKDDSISEFLSLARSKVGPPKQESSPLVNKEEEHVKEPLSDKVFGACRFSLPGWLWPLTFSMVMLFHYPLAGVGTFSMKGQILNIIGSVSHNLCYYSTLCWV